jgi:hypothetical protein
MGGLGFFFAGIARNLKTRSQFIPAMEFKDRKLYYTNEVIPL